MRQSWFPTLGIVLLLLMAPSARADDIDAARSLLAAGSLDAAAQTYNRYAESGARDPKNMPEALAMTGRILDALSDSLTGAAEKACYWAKAGAAGCMQKYSTQYNARYGSGAFDYDPSVNCVVYTGRHYQTLLENYPRSAYVPEAVFYTLLRDLKGTPGTAIPKVKSFLSKYPKGEWNRRGLLLWARVHRDAWLTQGKSTWVIGGSDAGAQQLSAQAEPYRKEALATYQKLMKDKTSFEGRAAAEEYEALMTREETFVPVSLSPDANPGTLTQMWGLSNAPLPPEQAPDRGRGFKNEFELEKGTAK